MEIDVRKLAKAVRAKRGNRGYIRAAREVNGVHYSTRWHIEHGRAAKPETIERVCAWLDALPRDFEVEEGSSEMLGTVDEIEVLLSTDPLLDTETASVIAQVVRLAYKAAVER